MTPYFPHKTRRRLDTLTVPERIALALSFLKCEGGGLGKVVKLFGRSAATVMNCVTVVCELICRVYFKDVICFPTYQDIRETTASMLVHRRFPMVFGAIDGKHFEVSGGLDAHENQMLRNYKRYLSLNVIGVADHNYRFRSIGDFFPGSVTDGRAFRKGDLYRFLHSSEWTNFCASPEIEKIILNGKTIYPFLAGDAAFHGSAAVLKPFTQPECTRNQKAALFNKIHRYRSYVCVRACVWIQI